MTFKYKPHGLYARPISPARCPASVPNGGRSPGFHQCSRKPAAGGEWCHQHDPETVRKRDAARAIRWKEEEAAVKRARVSRGLGEATVDELRTELAKREALAQPEGGSQ